MGPMLVVDIQPAYTGGFGGRLTYEVLAEMRQMSEGQPLIILSVNEELSGDGPQAIQEFWEEQGMEEALFERAIFLEKPYAFFRGWMDNGVPDEDIVAVAKELRKQRKSDSRDLPGKVLAKISPVGAVRCDPLFLPYELEIEPRYRQASWRICGGGRDECLKEVELWLDSCNIAYNRIDHLTY
jgi:hypothetical protein